MYGKAVQKVGATRLSEAWWHLVEGAHGRQRPCWHLKHPRALAGPVVQAAHWADTPAAGLGGGAGAARAKLWHPAFSRL